MTKTSLALALFNAGAVKIDFAKGWTLKSGLWSPIYINLRILQSHPLLLGHIARMMVAVAREQKLKYSLVAGIPLGAIPLGIAYALRSGIPHILPRMDSKKHGLGVRVDGEYRSGQTVLLIDDLITAATSKLEAVQELNAAGLQVRDVMVVLDRQQGGEKQLTTHKLKLHTLLTIDELLTLLVKKKKLTRAVEKKLREYFAGTYVRS